MRNRLSAILVTFAAACGGGDTPTPIPVDTPVTPPGDTGPLACSVADFAQGLTLAGMNNTPAMGDWFTDPAEPGSPNEGKISFLIAARLPSDGGANPDVMAVELVKQNVFTTGQAVPFNTDPGAMNYNAASFMIGNFSQATMSFDHFYWAGSGSITVNMIGENDGNTITGTVSATAYAEIDEMNAVVSGGCTSMLGGLNFNLQQMAMPMPFDDTSNPQLFTRDELRNIYSIIQQKRAQMRDAANQQ